MNAKTKRNKPMTAAAATRASITFPPELYSPLEAIAKSKKVSVAWVVRDAVERYVADGQKHPRKDARVESIGPVESLMAIHPDFPPSPYETLNPGRRWFPAAGELRATAYEKLLPPLVANIREDVTQWRAGGYAGASATSRALLARWFQAGHLVERSDGTESEFRNCFAQREAVETVIWLHDVWLIRDKSDLVRFDASGTVSVGMFEEEWPPYVVKMAADADKTKVLSLLIDWCSFRELKEPALRFTRNCLLIAPDGRRVN